MIYVLFCAVPDFLKTNPLKTQTTRIIKKPSVDCLGHPKLMSFSLFEYALAARWELCNSSFIAPQVQEEIREMCVILPWHWLNLKHTSRQVRRTWSWNGCLTEERGVDSIVWLLGVWGTGLGKVTDLLVGEERCWRWQHVLLGRQPLTSPWRQWDFAFAGLGVKPFSQ